METVDQEAKACTSSEIWDALSQRAGGQVSFSERPRVSDNTVWVDGVEYPTVSWGPYGIVSIWNIYQQGFSRNGVD